jgi:sulfur relay (sulfurtransferase) DsrC/TusE family protein
MRYIISERQYKLLCEQPETTMDRRGTSVHQLGKNLGNLSVDDTVDVISAAFDAVPGIGNAISLGIDGLHGISYIIRFIYSKTTEEQIEYACMALITLGTSYLPVGGNAASILMRKGIKDVLRYTPVEIMMLGQKLGLVDKTKFFLSKKAWKYNLLLVLAKIFRSKLSESLSAVIKKLNQIYEKIKNVDSLKTLSGSLLTFISLLKELSNESDLAVKLVELGKI